MAWRIEKQVVRGFVDNRQPGRVVGKLWLAGLETPVELDLQGNPLSDVAGCLLTFSNPKPEAGEGPGLDTLQTGTVGDMTASRKARVPDVPIEELAKWSRQGKPIPCHIANVLYLEWFSDANGRVVVEAADWSLELSAPAWHMTREQAAEQVERNREALRGFIDRIMGEEDPPTTMPDPAFGPDADQPMDEFQWEDFLKESDARSDRFMQIFEKYEGHPDREKLVAREMGWTWLDEMLEAQERGALETPEEDVAYLKRALRFLHEALAAMSRVESKRLLPPGDLASYRAQLLGIREDALALMQRFRRESA